ncbi:MAG: DNA mismatch repair endonuclease MutL [Defluviitaleaceae bacterium]|nr:DNA mismatch repair endonuclease MutL [Defluviitaleaceae bacterium]
MSEIIQLDQILINKIAAGEVVERPLSVVKELTENSIDAGATIITVEIRDGGLTSVRVADNGGGIPPDSLPLAFARHATSKIISFDDLMQVQTLGFRGEALSSIAAVAQVEMVTKTKEGITGTRTEVHGGQVVSSKEIGCADGTSITVANLFYNTPARRKFLKKPAVEAGYISHCLERLALGNPSLVIKYINNGQLIFQTTGNGDLKTAMLSIYGRETAVSTVAVDAAAGDLHLFGLVGKPEIARGNRRHGSFFINGRYIESKLITRAVESAMRTMLPSGKFPIYALSLTMPHNMLDVNVHPTKMDVRFANEEEVFAFVQDAVRDVLEEANLIPRLGVVGRGGRGNLGVGGSFSEGVGEQISLGVGVGREGLARGREDYPLQRDFAVREDYPLRGDSARRDFTVREDYPLRGDFVVREDYPLRGDSTVREDYPLLGDSSARGDYPVREDSARRDFTAREDYPLRGNFTAREDYPMQEDSTTPEKIFTDYVIHGLIFQTYWLVSQGDSLFIIDQHAAHERVIYENLLNRVQDEAVHSQNLLMPIPLRLTPREKQTLHDNREIFARFGFEISRDLETPEIVSVPLLMTGPLSASFFTDLLDKMGEAGFSYESPYAHKTEMIAMAACKAAVKAGDKKSDSEARALIEQLLGLDNPFTCPHGRPTIIEVTRGELERRFKR